MLEYHRRERFSLLHVPKRSMLHKLSADLPKVKQDFIMKNRLKVKSIPSFNLPPFPF